MRHPYFLRNRSVFKMNAFGGGGILIISAIVFVVLVVVMLSTGLSKGATLILALIPTTVLLAYLHFRLYRSTIMKLNTSSSSSRVGIIPKATTLRKKDTISRGMVLHHVASSSSKPSEENSPLHRITGRVSAITPKIITLAISPIDSKSGTIDEISIPVISNLKFRDSIDLDKTYDFHILRADHHSGSITFRFEIPSESIPKSGVSELTIRGSFTPVSRSHIILKLKRSTSFYRDDVHSKR